MQYVGGWIFWNIQNMGAAGLKALGKLFFESAGVFYPWERSICQNSHLLFN